MMLRLPSLAVFAALLSGLSCAANAQDLPASAEGYVLDLAEVLDAPAEARIEAFLSETVATTGVTMEVVTLTDFASYGGAGERLDAYAARLLQAWAIGSPERNDGLLIVVTTDPADARIALGSGYAPVYDKRAARVLGDFVLPAFREGRIPDGIEAGVKSARDRLITPFLTGAPVTASEGFDLPAPRLAPTVAYGALALAVAGLVIALMLRNARLRKTCPSCGERTLNRTFEVIEAPVGQNEGSGIEHRVCTNCGHIGRQVYSLKRGFAGGYRRKQLK